MSYLPDEIINIIWIFVTPVQKIGVDKKHYYKFNYLIDRLIPNIRYDSYVRDMIRNDFIFIFNFLLNRKYIYWLNRVNYKYNNIIYPSYIHFLLDFTHKNNASKCNNLINVQLNLSGLKKEWCKNNRIKHNKWSN